MTLRFLSRFRRKSADSAEGKIRNVLSVIRKSLISSWKPTHYQVKEISDAYVSLWSSMPSEAQARAIYSSLVQIAQSTNKPCALDWLAAEILFEAFVASSGDRVWAARMELEHNSYGSKEKALCLYNERLARVF